MANTIKRSFDPTPAKRPHHVPADQAHKHMTSMSDGKLKMRGDDGSHTGKVSHPENYCRMTPDTDGDGM